MATLIEHMTAIKKPNGELLRVVRLGNGNPYESFVQLFPNYQEANGWLQLHHGSNNTHDNRVVQVKVTFEY